ARPSSPTAPPHPLPLHGRSSDLDRALVRRRARETDLFTRPRRESVGLEFGEAEVEEQALHGALLRLVPLGGGIAHHEGVDRLLRSEEHTSELQSRENLVCRLPLA